MYTTQRDPANFSESKYVADILSSMANGEPITPSYPMPGFLSGVTTATTPTLTPTTLANIEKTFIELQAAPVSSHDPNALTQSGFVPPVVDPVTSNGHSIDRYDYSDDPDWMPGGKRARASRDVLASAPYPTTTTHTPGRKGGRRPREEKLNPEEEQRRAVRRERNKLAAAKCRQRRVDHTNVLVKETEKLESEKSSLEDDIQKLQQQKDQLEFILKAHQPLCKVESRTTYQHITPISIKQERGSSPCSVQSCDSSSSQSSLSSSRPSSLVIPKSESRTMTTLAGIPISTPSSGLFSFVGLDSLVDANGLSLRSSPTCGSQVHRTSSDSSTDAVGSPTSTLISL
ncbi:hypothetical protein SNE40_010346 [Patella caerulea]|uniref:BZIP domain-containing protein n=1 Tax=Patella caerulea TaxID=87958 RepID=A0AAN8PUG3_PATCE